MITILSYGDTDTGREKELNEDRFLINENLGIYAVADGLGGLPEGAKAASLATELLEQFIKANPNKAEIDFHKLYNKINHEVNLVGRQIAEQTSIGTTLSSLFIHKNTAQIGQVGDSAVFLIRNKELTQLTEEHTMAAELATAYEGNEQNIPEFMFHTLTACIGQNDPIDPQTLEIKIQENDRFLLCSDGISKYLEKDCIRKECIREDTAESIVKKLLHIANNLGGIDNATCILLSCQSNQN